jgi:hypothetical protein
VFGFHKYSLVGNQRGLKHNESGERTPTPKRKRNFKKSRKWAALLKSLEFAAPVCAGSIWRS